MPSRVCSRDVATPPPPMVEIIQFCQDFESFACRIEDGATMAAALVHFSTFLSYLHCFSFLFMSDSTSGKRLLHVFLAVRCEAEGAEGRADCEINLQNNLIGKKTAKEEFWQGNVVPNLEDFAPEKCEGLGLNAAWQHKSACFALCLFLFHPHSRGFHPRCTRRLTGPPFSTIPPTEGKLGMCSVGNGLQEW